MFRSIVAEEGPRERQERRKDRNAQLGLSLQLKVAVLFSVSIQSGCFVHVLMEGLATLLPLFCRLRLCLCGAAVTRTVGDQRCTKLWYKNLSKWSQGSVI